MKQRFTPESRVTVHPFTRVAEEDEVVIGRPEGQVFVAVPPIGVEVLDRLAEGSTIRDAQTWLEAEYGEAPDIADFLANLERGGFVSPYDGAKETGKEREPEEAAEGVTVQPVEPKHPYHFEGFPIRWARLLFGAPALWVYWLVMVGALAATCVRPEIMPGRSALVFRSQTTLSGLILTGLVLLAVFIHEMAHLVAARSVGVSARLGLGHRLWFLVAETDLTGLWRVPREQRSLPILAGPLADATMASTLLLLAFARHQAGWQWPAVIVQFAEALTFALVLRLVWQLFFFMRTDLYYLVANLAKCKNLMEDTRRLIRHLWARLLGRKPTDEWVEVPDRERRAVRAYALFWLGGRGAALAMFALVQIPVLVEYLAHSSQLVRAGPGGEPLRFLDGLVTFCVSISMAAAGLVLWLRSILRKEKV